MPADGVEAGVHAANVWDRSAPVAFGAPPKRTQEPRHRGTAAQLVRRNPTPTQAIMLRKTRNFALDKFDKVPEHQTNYGEWAELVTKPPREDAEIQKEWVASALRAGWNQPGTSQVRQLEPVDPSLAEIERVEYPEGGRRSAGEGMIARLGVSYTEQPEEFSWPEQLVLKMPTFGGGENVGEQQRYHLAELTFLTEAVHNASHSIALPGVHWFFMRPPGEGEIREHWRWAKGVPVYDGQYPFELGEYCCLMEDLYDCAPMVDGELEREQAEDIIKALAALHAAFWENEEVIDNPCFKTSKMIKMNDTKEVVDGLLERSQLPEHVATMLIPAAEMRNELLSTTLKHGQTLTRGAAGYSTASWVQAPQGVTSMSWGELSTGIACRDLALLLTLCLSKEQQDDWTLPLKQLYYDTLVASGA